MKQRMSVSELTWCPKLPDFTLLADDYYSAGSKHVRMEEYGLVILIV